MHKSDEDTTTFCAQVQLFSIFVRVFDMRAKCGQHTTTIFCTDQTEKHPQKHNNKNQTKFLCTFSADLDLRAAPKRNYDP